VTFSLSILTWDSFEQPAYFSSECIIYCLGVRSIENDIISNDRLIETHCSLHKVILFEKPFPNLIFPTLKGWFTHAKRFYIYLIYRKYPIHRTNGNNFWARHYIIGRKNFGIVISIMDTFNISNKQKTLYGWIPLS